MKTEKLLLFLSGAIILLLISSNILQYTKNKKLLENLNQGTATQESHAVVLKDPFEKIEEDVRESSDPPADKDYHMNFIGELEYHLGAAEEELDMLSAQLAEKTAIEEMTEKERAQRQREAFSRFIDRDYALLYERLYLSPERLEEFKRILIDWGLANNERNQLAGTASTAAEREEIYRMRQETRDKYERELIGLMGAGKFKIYDDFKNRRRERAELNDFMQTVSPGSIIPDTQMEYIIDAMYDARKSVERTMGFDPDRIFNTPEDQSAVIEYQRLVFNEWEKSAGHLMPTDYAKQYEDYMKNQREMAEAMQKMLMLTEKVKKPGLDN